MLESVNPPHCSLEKTLLHGYPFKPTCISLDPVQKILAIGNKFGQIRFLGKPGIDTTFQLESRRYEPSPSGVSSWCRLLTFLTIPVLSSNWSGSSTLVRFSPCARMTVFTYLMSNRDRWRLYSSSGWSIIYNVWLFLFNPLFSD